MRAARFIAFASLAFLLTCGADAWARASPRPAPRDTAIYDIPPVTVNAARPRTTTGGASAVEVTLDSSAVRPAPTLEQVLREMPLVVIRANSRGEAQPALRGAEDRQIAVLVDGVPITLAWDHRSDLSIVPLTSARRVTLSRGLSSLLMGPNALGGAVEVDIARGGGADAPPPRLVLDAAVDQTGARSAAITAGFLRADTGGQWVLRTGCGYRGSDGFALAHGLERAESATYARLTRDGDRRLNTDLEAFDGFVSLRRSGRGGAWASFTGTGYRLERGVAPEAHTSEPRLWRYPFQARGLGALSGGTGMRVTPWGCGDLEVSVGVDAGRTEIDEYGAVDYRDVVGGERDDDRTLTARLLGDHTLGGRGDLRMALTYADVSHDEVIGTDPSASYRQRLWSLASETDWRFRVGVPVRLSAGGAADGADTPESSDKPALDRLWDWGGRVGATGVLRGGTLLAHGAASHRARFPALRELYSGALGRFLENPGLSPEVQWVNEAGVTLRHARGEFQLVGFHQVLEDGIARVSVTTPAGRKFQRVNQGRVTADGIEMLGDAAFGRFAVGGDLTLQRPRGLAADGTDTELEYEPAVHGGVWCEAPLPGRARLGAGVRGMGEQRYIDLDSGDFAVLSASVRLDLRLSRGFALGNAGPWRRVDALLSVENVADQTVFDQAGLPQPGRTIRVRARLW
jgi:iron complex outermembrane receptor protein